MRQLIDLETEPKRFFWKVAATCHTITPHPAGFWCHHLLGKPQRTDWKGSDVPFIILPWTHLMFPEITQPGAATDKGRALLSTYVPNCAQFVFIGLLWGTVFLAWLVDHVRSGPGDVPPHTNMMIIWRLLGSIWRSYVCCGQGCLPSTSWRQLSHSHGCGHVHRFNTTPGTLALVAWSFLRAAVPVQVSQYFTFPYTAAHQRILRWGWLRRKNMQVISR